MIKLLLDYGADIHAVNKEGENAHDMAMHHPKIQDFLRSKGLS